MQINISAILIQPFKLHTIIWYSVIHLNQAHSLELIGHLVMFQSGFTFTSNWLMRKSVFCTMYIMFLYTSSSSSILQAVPLFEAYWLGISIFGHDPTRASLLTRHSAAHYNASIALVALTGGDIGTIHVQVHLLCLVCV